MPVSSDISLQIGDPNLAEALQNILALVGSAGGKALLVGGCVRDALLGLEAKDLDIEVFGLTPETLRKTLARSFALDTVGQSFGVIKIRSLPIDIALPRRESKAGLGHKGFDVQSDPHMSLEEAMARRDFTINAMAFDAVEHRLMDCYGGRTDLAAGVLRHTSEKFSEDPLRVLRGMQFAARFDLRAAPETLALCRQIVPEGLPAERLFDEWRKLILRGVKPSSGLTFLRDSGWVQYAPELAALIGCEQEPAWHPEGDVWTHTLHCLDAFAKERTGDDWEDLIVGLAVLCHDLGKPATTRFEDGRLRSRGHEEAGEGPTRSFLSRLTNQQDLIDAVVALVLDHMRPVELHEGAASDRAIRRLACRVKRIDRLVRVARADQRGRPPLVVETFPAGDWLLERARNLAVENQAPDPILKGRHLIALGLKPGPRFGLLLSAVYEAQIEGKVTHLEEGLAMVRQMIAAQDGQEPPKGDSTVDAGQ